MKYQSFFVALKKNFIRITFNGKTLLALLFFTVFMIAIWGYHLQVEWYNEIHGVRTDAKPREQAKTYMFYFSAFTFLIYLFIVLRSTVKIKKSR